MSAQRLDAMPIAAVIVSRRGSRRRKLEAIISAMPGLTLSGWAENLGTALRLIGTCRPNLVLLDTDLAENEAWILIRQIGSSWPAMSLIVLAYDDNHFDHAVELGVEFVLPPDISMAGLLSVVDQCTAQIQE
jgi:DNA-binding NarL/FixJ family response regulator